MNLNRHAQSSGVYHWPVYGRSGNNLKQLLRTMKISALLLFIGLLHVAAMTKAQQITLHLKDASFETAIAQVHQQTGYAFLYNTDYLKNAKPVTVDINHASISQALAAIFDGQPFTYQVSAKSIVVTPLLSVVPDTTNTPAGHPVHGTVTDSTGSALSGVTIRIKGMDRIAVTDASGTYSIDDVAAGGILVFSMIGYQAQEIKVGAEGEIDIVLHPETAALHEVNVVSTGYQTLPEERATGSFDKIDGKLIDRSVSTNILDRINGIASGVFFNNSAAFTGISGDVNNNKTGISIRGVSTLNPALVGGDPLIVVDNFPYLGDLRNINPNDVASITILKDAAAASIWGARAGNGVIVITTKKGNFNQPVRIEFNASASLANKPDLSYDKNYLNSSDYINAESHLFRQGYFDNELSDNIDWPVISPVVEILNAQRNGTITDTEAASQINALRGNDVRKDFEKYVYQKAFSQQYSLGLRGGSQQFAYDFSLGYDNNRDNLIRNGQQRITVNSNNTYRPMKNLRIDANINYSQSNIQMNNQLPFGAVFSGGDYGLIPYMPLADNKGNPLAIVKDYRMSYVDSIGKLGFLNNQYMPLNEIANADYTGKINDLLLKGALTYQFNDHFNAQFIYQNEHQVSSTTNDQNLQSYYARNLINQFSQYAPATGSFTYPIPMGGILNEQDYTINNDNGRLQLNYNQQFKHNQTITAIAGAELSQSISKGRIPTIYGYDKNYGTAVTNLDYYDGYSTNPSGYSLIPASDESEYITTYRYISYFANAGYTYDNRYTATISARKDGANIFGAKTNDKITPLWSVGLSWEISNEKFYHSGLFPYLKLRTSYGFNGNVYNGSAYTTGVILNGTLTGAQYVNALTPPNPELRWEKVKNINIGLDFATRNNVIKGTIEPYLKQGEDLIEAVPLAASSGFTSYTGNAAATKTTGLDITLTSKNIWQKLKWQTTLLYSYNHDKVVNYDVTQTVNSIQTLSGVALLGKPIYSIFSYKWAGIDPTDGDPLGYLNGKVSKDYTAIINNYSPDSLKFNGSARPTSYGSIRNDFYYGSFSLSFNITYELGWYFRRPSVSLNYSDILKNPNTDYTKAWTAPGDQTNVPSLVYPSDNNRNTFYQYSDILVQSGNNIRLQDIRIGYDIDKHLLRRTPFKSLEIYTYASNIGILWRANKYGIDPDAVTPVFGGHAFPNPFTIAFGIKANL